MKTIPFKEQETLIYFNRTEEYATITTTSRPYARRMQEQLDKLSDADYGKVYITINTPDKFEIKIPKEWLRDNVWIRKKTDPKKRTEKPVKNLLLAE
jgi:hypothetical protein